MHSLMCRRSRIGLLNNIHEGSLSSNNQKEPREELKSSLAIKCFFEKHYSLRVVLLLFVLMGTSMVIGDGVFTPTMSGKEPYVLSSLKWFAWNCNFNVF